MKLKTRMILLLGMMCLLQTLGIGIFTLTYLNQSLDEQIAQRALHVAKTVAIIPTVISAIERNDSNTLQPLASQLAKKNDALFVVIGDREGIRLAHPTAAKLGKPMHDDEGDENVSALIHGKPYTQKAVGSLGPSVRGKAPVFDLTDEKVIGIVSVGFSLAAVADILNRYQLTLTVVILVSFTLSVFFAIGFASHFKKAIFGLEPEQIARLFQERNATLESVREGIIAINNDGVITTFNQAAINTLGLDSSEPITGKHIYHVLPDSELMLILDTGKPDFDKEVWLQDKKLIVNRLPVISDEKIVGVVSSFRRKDELDAVTSKLAEVQAYADSLRSQAHEYSNKLHTIAGLIQISAFEEALSYAGQESRSHQALIDLLVQAVPDPIVSGCLLGKFNRAKEMGLELFIDPDSSMQAIPDSLSREKLVSILGNLIDNALEATLTNHRRLVSLSMTDLGNDLIFEIEDQGRGLTDIEQSSMFDKGVSSKEEAGHGFGLHLVKQLLSDLAGDISFESALKEGTRCVVTIPKVRPV
ncbi:histidine kinase [Veronia pacifica]|uniref:histidine kinase n=2 Tax=Veronia pacifica TaxID=1080227 RepID=A0A1C3EPI8_9GAMM|nr:histidine kinase [Veronia pacifica]